MKPTTASLLILAAGFVQSSVAKEEPLLAEDFENTRDGEIPRHFTAQGKVEVTSETAHTGKKSLLVHPAERGPRRIVTDGRKLAKLGDSHWGRLYLKVGTPAPRPTKPPGKNFAVIHATFVELKGTSPLHDDPIAVRVVDTCTSHEGKVQWLYNVQPSKRPEFATGSKFAYEFGDDWMLCEWFVDHQNQTYRFFVDKREIREIEIKGGKENFENIEIPEKFTSIAFGLNNYQPAGEGFTAWIDDIALGKERIGDNFLGK